MTSFPSRATDAFARSAQIAGAVPLDKLQPDDIPWLWPGRIPRGRLTLLVGDLGLGKSLVTLDVAARVSRGAPWPGQLIAQGGTPGASSDGRGELAPTTSFAQPQDVTLQPASVLLLNAEDDLADTVLPCLNAAGADCSRIVAIPSIISPSGTGDAPSDFILHRELARINQLLDHLPDCRLVVVDPMSAYVTGSANSSGEVRKLLAPLAQLAHERKLAVLAVSHLHKDGSAIYRTLGSLGFVSAARAAWVISRDPSNRARRLMLPVKNNIAADTTGLAYTIESLPTGLPTIRWAAELVSTAADDALRPRVGHPRSERDDAIHWLRQ